MIYDAELEQAVIGGLLQTQEPRKWLLALSPEDFASPANRAMLAAMQIAAAKREPYDAASIAKAAQRDAPGEDLTAAAIEAVRRTPSLVMLPRNIDALRVVTTRRKMQTIAEAISAAAYDPTQEPDEARAAAIDELRKLSAGRGSWVEIASLVSSTLDEMEAAAMGKAAYLTTGVADLDMALGGLFPGEMTVLGARPAVGKSALAAYMAMHIAGAGKKVGVCSLEMTPSQYLRRLIAARSGVEGRKLRTGKGLTEAEWVRVGDAANELANLPMPFTFSVRNVETLRAEAEKRKDQQGLDMLVVDYLQLMGTAKKTDGDFARITTVSHELKALAIDLKIPVLALAQVSRPTEKGRLKMPTMDCLRGSGDIEQDADSIVFLHRPEALTDPSVPEEDKAVAETAIKYGNQYIAVKVAKNRNDGIAEFGLIFDPSHMTYKCIAKG